jgi:hypothetical protein
MPAAGTENVEFLNEPYLPMFTFTGEINLRDSGIAGHGKTPSPDIAIDNRRTTNTDS